MKKTFILCLTVPLLITIFFINPIMSSDLERISFKSHGSTLYGYFSEAQGKGPHPTMVLLHGSPGGKKDVFGLAQAAPKAGWNALVFNYRGFYESEGMSSLNNSVEDVFSALNFIRSDEIVRKYDIDTAHTALAGYSYGGDIALTAAAKDTSIQYVISIAAADISEIARIAENNDKFRAMFVETMNDRISKGLVKGPGGKQALKELLENKDKFDIIKHAENLSYKSLLIIGGWKDQASTLEEHVLPLIRALQKNGAEKVEKVILDTDHSFIGARTELTNAVVSWLDNHHPHKKPAGSFMPGSKRTGSGTLSVV